ncbi:MAG: hypothetical protein AAFU03_14945, partial [Bacteroidota bacterium]
MKRTNTLAFDSRHYKYSGSYSDYFWEDTLADFLESSNEIEVTKKVFISKVLPMLKELMTEDLRWLEVGCGDFTKTMKFLESYNVILKNRPANFDIVEPSDIWRQGLQSIEPYQSKELFTETHIYPKKLEDWTEAVELPTYDLVTIIQVLYNPAVIDGFFHLLERTIAAKQKTIFFLSVESIGSDLNKIRKDLAQGGFLKYARSSYAHITKRLKAYPLAEPIITTNTNGKSLRV